MKGQRLETGKIKLQHRDIGKYQQYYVTIPINYINKLKLKKGDLLLINEQDKYIIIQKESD